MGNGWVFISRYAGYFYISFRSLSFFLYLVLYPGRLCVWSHFSCVGLFVTTWTVAHQVLLSMGFSRQEYWCEKKKKILEWIAMPSSRGSSQPSERILHWQVGSLPLAPPGMPPGRLTCMNFINGFPALWLPVAAAAAKSLQLCLTLCDPIDGSPPGSPVPGILQARTLE